MRRSGSPRLRRQPGLPAVLVAAWLAGCAAPQPPAPVTTTAAPVVAAPQSSAAVPAPPQERPATALRIKPQRPPGEGAGAPALRAPEVEPPLLLASGQASFYADSLHGRRTANGERYDREELTAAHRSLPFGARLCVRSLVNGRTVIVRVTDRGPFTPGRLTDPTRPDYSHTSTRFGPERCMFESHFPVDKVSVSYPVLWNAFKRIAAGFREEEKDAMFYGTANRFYRLG